MKEKKLSIEIIKNTKGIYELNIEDKFITENKMLKPVIDKIIKYSKMTFIDEEKKGGLVGMFDKIMKGD